MTDDTTWLIEEERKQRERAQDAEARLAEAERRCDQLQERLVCIHSVSLDEPCNQCEGKAGDGGWDGYGWRIVDPAGSGDTPE